jgi:hypothetical protein
MHRTSSSWSASGSSGTPTSCLQGHQRPKEITEEGIDFSPVDQGNTKCSVGEIEIQDQMVNVYVRIVLASLLERKKNH